MFRFLVGVSFLLIVAVPHVFANANAVVSLDLIVDGGAGNQIDDGVLSGAVSGQGTKIAVEVFAKGVVTSLFGVKIEFDFDSSVLKFDKAENSAFAFIIPEVAGANIAAPGPVSLPASGFIGRAEFSTVANVTGKEFYLGIKAVTLAESATKQDRVTSTSRIVFNSGNTQSTAARADFDGSGVVDFADFLMFFSSFGSYIGQQWYETKFDLDNNGAVNMADFLLFVSVFGQTVQGAGSVEGDRNALIALYNSTNGNVWINNENWLSFYQPISKWHGVKTDENGRVVSLNLEYNRLSGSIPPVLGELSRLKGLNLEGNQLSGPIPASIGNLSNLRDLNLGINQLSGSIPPELGNLTNLTYLVLSRNQLSGSIPPELGNLSNLEWLSLGINQLSGSIPSSLGNLFNLVGLGLDYNQLSGPIPPELGNLSNLRDLDLGINQLSGSIPPELGNLTNLESLNLIYNDLSGAIPSWLGNLSNLRDLDLGGNQLSGPIPPELGNLSNLRDLNLGINQLSGSIPPELGNLTNLTYLVLSRNQLSGSIPPELGNLSKLEHLIVFGNQLSGSIPPELGNLSRGTLNVCICPTINYRVLFLPHSAILQNLND